MVEFVRTVRAHEGETVEIQWTCDDGIGFVQRIAIPPKATREARRAQEQHEQEQRRAALGLDVPEDGSQSHTI